MFRFQKPDSPIFPNWQILPLLFEHLIALPDIDQYV
jgi:hypothetical protein